MPPQPQAASGVEEAHNAQIEALMNQPRPQWEEEFDNLEPPMKIPFDVGMEFFEYDKAVKKFIAKTLATNRTALLQTLKERVTSTTKVWDKNLMKQVVGSDIAMQWYNDAINDVISIIESI